MSNEIIVAGGVIVASLLQLRLPQSPVLQTMPISLQYVRAQIFPSHVQGGSEITGFDSCVASANPDDEGVSLWMVSVAGQIVQGQLFVIVNVVALLPVHEKNMFCVS